MTIDTSSAVGNIAAKQVVSQSSALQRIRSEASNGEVPQESLTALSNSDNDRAFAAINEALDRNTRAAESARPVQKPLTQIVEEAASESGKPSVIVDLSAEAQASLQASEQSSVSKGQAPTTQELVQTTNRDTASVITGNATDLTA